MIIKTRSFLLALAAVALDASGIARAADLKHDLYVCTTLSGQGSIIGSRAPVQSGVYRSSDRQTFEHLGPNHIRMFKVIPDLREPGAIFVTALDGVLHSRDRGASWHRQTNWEMTEAKGIAVDPHAPDNLYIGLPDGIGVSRDDGQTWQRMNGSIRRSYTQTITVDASKKDRVLAGTEKGIFLTEDGARTWRLVQATDNTTYDLRQSPHDPRVFFAVTSTNGAFWSDNAGVTWRHLAGVPDNHTLHNCDFDASDARRLVLCGWEAGLLVSEDGGSTWNDRTAGLPNRQIWSVSTDPDIPGRLYAAPYMEALHVSDDFGHTWRPLYFEKAIVYNITFIPRP